MIDISPFIKQVARGKHGAENLTQDEAKDVFAALLDPEADPLQMGAFLIAQRMKGETSAELAGFVEAAQAGIEGFGSVMAPHGAVDLPCYAGKRRDAHAYLIAAMQARESGVPVVVHGVSQIDGRVTAWQVLQGAGVKKACCLNGAAEILQYDGIVYLDLAEMCPDLFRVYNLRSRIGVRSFANTVARLINPMQCEGQLNGFFHTPYAAYMAEANILLNQQRSLIFMGAEGDPELYADRQKVVMKQEGDRLSHASFAAAGLAPYPREGMDLTLLTEHFAAMLKGDRSERQAAVIATMDDAFRWASEGVFPKQWQEEKL